MYERDKVTRDLRKKNLVRSYVFCIHHQMLSGGQIKKNDLGGTYSTYENGIDLYRVWWGILRERDHLKDPYLNERIIFE